VAYLQARASALGTRWNVYYRKAPGGRPKFHKSYGTLAEAEAVRQMLEREVEKKEVKGTASPGLDVLAEFMSSRQVTPATLDFYERRLRQFVVAQGQKPMGEWTARDLEAFLRSNTGWADSTRNATVRACRMFSKWAVKRGYRCADFASTVETTREESVERRPRTKEEFDAVMAQAEKESHPFLLPLGFARWAGMSYGDFSRVTKDEIDLEAGLIRRKRHKTKRGKPIPIASPLRALLDRFPVMSGPVCRGLHPRENGGNNDTATLHALERRAGVKVEKGDGWHSFRHLAISEVVKAGGLAAGRDFAQHAANSGETNRYSHADDGLTRAAVEKAATGGGM
jgi:integrase